jgi:hypothetical protein
VDNLEEFFSGGVEWRQQHQSLSLLMDIQFSKQDIEWACNELKSSSSTGPDGVSSLLLKTASKELCHPLFLLWCASMDQGIFYWS